MLRINAKILSVPGGKSIGKWNQIFINTARLNSMCLAIPSKIVKIENNVATIDVDGVQREASLFLLEDVKVGDYVIVHAGYAINKIDEDHHGV